jgi:hypothetical protein
MLNKQDHFFLVNSQFYFLLGKCPFFIPAPGTSDLKNVPDAEETENLFGIYRQADQDISWPAL